MKVIFAALRRFTATRLGGRTCRALHHAHFSPCVIVDMQVYLQFLKGSLRVLRGQWFTLIDTRQSKASKSPLRDLSLTTLARKASRVLELRCACSRTKVVSHCLATSLMISRIAVLSTLLFTLAHAVCAVFTTVPQIATLLCRTTGHVWSERACFTQYVCGTGDR